MDIFSHLFVVRIIKFVWKDENKRKRGRGWPIFKKQPLRRPSLLRGFICTYLTAALGFESQSHHPCFFQFVLLKLWWVKDKNRNKKRPGLVHFLKQPSVAGCSIVCPSRTFLWQMTEIKLAKDLLKFIATIRSQIKTGLSCEIVWFLPLTIPKDSFFLFLSLFLSLSVSLSQSLSLSLSLSFFLHIFCLPFWHKQWHEEERDIAREIME